MHNKAMIVDNSVAIVGGRNIANSYFTVSGDYDLGDIDILAAGPTAGQVSVAFDDFWNDGLAIPIEAFESKEHTAAYARVTRENLNAFRAAARSSPYAKYLRGSEPNKAFEFSHLRLVWAHGEVLYDRPRKVLTSIDEDPSAYMVLKLQAVLDAATWELLLILL